MAPGRVMSGVVNGRTGPVVVEDPSSADLPEAPNRPRMARLWEMSSAADGSPEASWLLERGWEPFGVVKEKCGKYTDAKTGLLEEDEHVMVYFRRQIWKGVK